MIIPMLKRIQCQHTAHAIESKYLDPHRLASFYLLSFNLCSFLHMTTVSGWRVESLSWGGQSRLACPCVSTPLPVWKVYSLPHLTNCLAQNRSSIAVPLFLSSHKKLLLRMHRFFNSKELQRLLDTFAHLKLESRAPPAPTHCSGWAHYLEAVHSISREPRPFFTLSCNPLPCDFFCFVEIGVHNFSLLWRFVDTLGSSKQV